MDEEPPEKKRGPRLSKVTLSIEDDLITWGKDIPGGLSLLARIVFRQIKDGEIEVKVPTKPKDDKRERPN